MIPRMPWDRVPLSVREKEIYDYIVEYYKEKGQPPTYAEIGYKVKLSRPGVYYRIVNLYNKGWVAHERMKKRSALPLTEILGDLANAKPIDAPVKEE
jgi:SOS-response transcriptional repressor LexA